MASIDCEESFESVIRSPAMQPLVRHGVDERYISITFHMRSEKWVIDVIQGDTISSKFFRAYFEELFNKVQEDNILFRKGDEYVNKPRFINNIVEVNL